MRRKVRCWRVWNLFMVCYNFLKTKSRAIEFINHHIKLTLTVKKGLFSEDIQFNSNLFPIPNAYLQLSFNICNTAILGNHYKTSQSKNYEIYNSGLIKVR